MLNLWGGDSDIILDLCLRVNPNVQFVFFNTGIEYEATLEHLDYLEDKYKITIHRENATIPVPLGVKKYRLPFLSKFVSEAIGSLQHHDFDFSNKDYEEIKDIPYAKWWCNKHVNEGYSSNYFDIDNTKHLKDYLIENPPEFPISNKCCEGAKKKPSKLFIKEHDVDLMILGIRKSEGGVRSTIYKNCFSSKSKNNIAYYRPIFWYKNNDKKDYENYFNIVHSRCYTEYGFKRTGCCCCPYGKDFNEELEIIKEKEPKLYKAVMNIFGKSYEYTNKYREFAKAKSNEGKKNA